MATRPGTRPGHPVGYPQDLHKQRSPATSLWVCSPLGRALLSSGPFDPPGLIPLEVGGHRVHVSDPAALSTRGPEGRSEGS